MPRRDFALVFILLVNAFSWSWMVLTLISGIPSNPTVGASMIAVFSIAASGAGLAGALLSEKIRRLHFLYVWMILGLLSSSLLIFIYSLTEMYLSLISILLGISFGLGMPSALAYLVDYTNFENRGLASALIFSVANFIALPLTILFTTLNPVVTAIILAVWRGLGLGIFAVLKPKEANFREKRKPVSFISIFRSRSFHLYLLPWAMFILIDALEKALLGDFLRQNFGQDFYSFILITEQIIGVFFILICGLLADRIGRKRVVIYGFVSLGIGYAILGLAPTMRMAWYFYVFVDGAAWGILFTIFLFVLWGDLSQPSTIEKNYAIGDFPFLIRSTISLLLIPVISLIPATAAFSLASFFLFVAVLPLMYAPETLPEKKMQIRRLKSYVEKAKKFTEKYKEK